MFRKLLLPVLLCGVLTLGGCGLPTVDVTINLPPKNAEQTLSKEAPTPSATTPIWKEMDAKWLGVKFKYPSDWMVDNQNYYVEKVEEGIADAKTIARFVDEEVPIWVTDDYASDIDLILLEQPIDFHIMTEAEWRYGFENAYAYTESTYYDGEYHDTPITVPYYDIEVLDYKEKTLGKNQVMRICVHAKYLTDEYTGYEPDPYTNDEDSPYYQIKYERYEAFWFVNLPGGKGFYVNYQTLNKSFPHIQEIEQMIASLTETEPSPFEEYFTYYFGDFF